MCDCISKNHHYITFGANSFVKGRAYKGLNTIIWLLCMYMYVDILLVNADNFVYPWQGNRQLVTCDISWIYHG